jgi:hypothetical protein
MAVPFDALRRIRNPRFSPGRTRYVSSRSAEARALGVMQSLGAMFNIPPSEAHLDTYGEDGGNYAPVRQSGPEPIDPGESIGPLLVDPSAVLAAERAGLSGCCGPLSGLSDNEKKYGAIAAVGFAAWLLWRGSKRR